eukprot:8864237-Pyramimonas_sp.AAC.1
MLGRGTKILQLTQDPHDSGSGQVNLMTCSDITKHWSRHFVVNNLIKRIWDDEHVQVHSRLTWSRDAMPYWRYEDDRRVCTSDQPASSSFSASGSMNLSGTRVYS